MDGAEILDNQEFTFEALNNGAGGETVTSENAPKTGPGKPARRGRPKGVPNKVNRIAKEAIADAEPHSFLIRIMEGRKFMRAGTEGAKRRVECYPTLRESVSAAETLLRKISPDLRATELTGKDGTPLIEPTRCDELLSKMEVARRIAFVLAMGDEAKKELAKMDAPRSDTEPQLIPEPEPETVTEAPEPSVPKEARPCCAES